MRNPNVSGYGYGDGQYGDRVYGLKSLSVSTLPPTSTITQIPDTTTTETSTQSIQALVDSSPFSILSDSTSTALTNRFVTTATEISNTTTTEASTQSIQALVDSSPFSAGIDSISSTVTDQFGSTATQNPIGRITVVGFEYGDGLYGEGGYGVTSQSIPTDQFGSTVTQIPSITTTEASTESIQPAVEISLFSILSDSTSTVSTLSSTSTITQIPSITTTETSTQSVQPAVETSPFSILSNSTSTELTDLSLSTATQNPIGRITAVEFGYGDGLYGESRYGVTSQSISTDRFGSTVTQIPDTTTTESVAQSVQPVVNSSQSTAVIDSTSTGSIIQPSSVISLNTVTISSAAIAEPRSLLSNLVTIIATNTNTNTTTQTTPVLDTASVIAVDSAINTVSDVPPIKSVVTLGDVDLTTTTTASIQSVRSSVSSSAFDIEITILLAQDPSRDINSTPTVEYADTDTDAVIYTTEHTNTYE